MTYTHLSDFELLERLIGETEARRLYTGSLAPLFFPPCIDGHTDERLVAAHELITRLLQEEVKRGPVMNQPSAVRLYLQALFAGKESESFVVLLLDTQHRLIAAETVANGTIDGASVYTREVVKFALRHNAGAVIFAHNHPSGIAEPSTADRLLTDKLRQAFSHIDVRVLDHFVVGGTEVVSFAERGWV